MPRRTATALEGINLSMLRMGANEKIYGGYQEEIHAAPWGRRMEEGWVQHTHTHVHDHEPWTDNRFHPLGRRRRRHWGLKFVIAIGGN